MTYITFKAREFSQTFGPATCGCVALYRWESLYMTPDGGRTSPLAWKQCPICLGSGTDPRVVRDPETYIPAPRREIVEDWQSETPHETMG